MDKELEQSLCEIFDEKLNSLVEIQLSCENKLDIILKQTSIIKKFRDETIDALTAMDTKIKALKNK